MEIWKNKNAKSFRIFFFTLPDVDDLIKHTFGYWHTRPWHAWQASNISGFMTGSWVSAMGWMARVMIIGILDAGRKYTAIDQSGKWESRGKRAQVDNY